MRRWTKGNTAGADETYRAAETARKRRIRNGLTFNGLRACLSWYYECKDRMQTPNGLFPRTEAVPGGDGYRGDERVLVTAEGGRGGNLDDVLATLTTVHGIIKACGHEYPKGTEALVLTTVAGRGQNALADEWRVAQGTLSSEVGHARAYLTGRLIGAGVLR